MRDDMSWLMKGGIITEPSFFYGDDGGPEIPIPLDKIEEYNLEINENEIIKKLIKKMEIKYDRRKNKRRIQKRFND